MHTLSAHIVGKCFNFTEEHLDSQNKFVEVSVSGLMSHTYSSSYCSYCFSSHSSLHSYSHSSHPSHSPCHSSSHSFFLIFLLTPLHLLILLLTLVTLLLLPLLLSDSSHSPCTLLLTPHLFSHFSSNSSSYFCCRLLILLLTLPLTLPPAVRSKPATHTSWCSTLLPSPTRRWTCKLPDLDSFFLIFFIYFFLFVSISSVSWCINIHSPQVVE